MKKIFLAMAAMTVAAGVAAASVTHKPSTDEVNQAIDSRLHAMLVKLNTANKK